MVGLFSWVSDQQLGLASITATTYTSLPGIKLIPLKKVGHYPQLEAAGLVAGNMLQGKIKI
jgi:hypothetical protein